MTTLAHVRRLQAQLIALRRYLHAHPELSWQESNTQQLICRMLDEIGIPYQTPHKTAVIATIQGKCAHPCTVLRADMDALAIQEANHVPYRSQNDGVMHACGHDAHVAMLLTAAKILYDQRNQLEGTVVLLFQPAEEIASGAKALLPHLAHADDFFALHVWSDFPLGKVSVEAGPRMAATDHLYWTVHGTGAHGAQPHHGVDAIVIAAHMICALQTVASRFTSPLEPVVLTMGQINGGLGYNIIADRVEIIGTLRTFDATVRQEILAQIEQIGTHTAQSMGGTCDFRCEAGNPPLVNHPASSARAQAAVERALGADFVAPMQPTMGGEDFAHYLQHASGCLAFVGARNEQTGKCAAHHHPCFDIDEQALVYGTAVLVEYALGNR